MKNKKYYDFKIFDKKTKKEIKNLTLSFWENNLEIVKKAVLFYFCFNFLNENNKVHFFYQIFKWNFNIEGLLKKYKESFYIIVKKSEKNKKDEKLEKILEKIFDILWK